MWGKDPKTTLPLHHRRIQRRSMGDPRNAMHSTLHVFMLNLRLDWGWTQATSVHLTPRAADPEQLVLASWSPSATTYTSQALVPHMQLLSCPSLAWLYQNLPLTHPDLICHSLPSSFSTQKALLSSLPTTYNPHSPSQCSETRHLPSSRGSPSPAPSSLDWYP